MDTKDSLFLSMYLDFRHYIDTLCFENLKKMSGNNFFEISYNNQTVGFLMIIDSYIDAIYVLPEYRRLGLARKAVIDAWKKGIKMESLHIVNGNTIADKFWRSIFTLSVQSYCQADIFYRIVGLKNNV